jgi:glycosyltransferase involved in cell wall biosynthesis
MLLSSGRVASLVAPCPMRVLHVYSGNLYGGVEALLTTLASHADSWPTLEQHFGLFFKGRLSEALGIAGAPIHHFGEVRIGRPWTVWRARRCLGEVLRKSRFDVVLCHSAWAQSVAGPVVRSAKIPLLFWLHGAVDGRHWLERLARLTPPDRAITNSGFTQGTLPSLYAGVPSDVIYPPVSPPADGDPARARSEVRAELDTPMDAVVVIQASRMEPLKGHRVHLEALQVLMDLPEWVCWLVGGAQQASEIRYRERLELMARDLGLAKRVRFLGHRSDVRRLLSAADVYCQPNEQPEAFGIAYVEALWAQKPVITSALGGALEIVDGSCGILVPPGDAQAVAAALRLLIRDPLLRRKLGATGPSRARALCEPAQQIGRLRGILEAAVGNTPSR